MFMINVIIQMKVLSKKRMELFQTLDMLTGTIRMEKGCNRWDIYQSIEDSNRLIVFEKWDNQANLMTHQETKQFKVLQGAINLMKDPLEKVSRIIFHTAGAEEVEF